MVESSSSAQRKDGERGVMLNSPVVSVPRRTKEKAPPPYGAQHRQDALWEGGNDALPPRWFQFQMLDDTMLYQDDTLVMTSPHQPLPGVRLDYAGQLVPRCEWHISPLGRSYFVDHNARTTSWKKPTPVRPPGSLTPECVIERHSRVIRSLACLGTSCNILSASLDGSIRQSTRDGEPVGRPWTSDGLAVLSMAISPDESMVVTGSADGKLRLWNIKKGSVVGDPWEWHSHPVRCLDWSPNAQEVASGSQDGTIRCWNPDTGRQIAPPIEAGRGVIYALKYSPQGDKLMSGGEDKVICVWSKDGELLREIGGHNFDVMSLCWSQEHIFSGSGDCTIRKWRLIDGEELAVFEGHTNMVASICLSPDESHLVSAASDYSVRIWDLKTNQLVGNLLLHNDEVRAIVTSADGKSIISGSLDGKIYVWSMDAVLKHSVDDRNADESNAKQDAKLKGRPVRSRDAILHASQISKQRPSNRPGGLAKYGKDFWDADTSSTPASPHGRPSFAHRWRNLLGSLRVSTRPSNAPQSIPLKPRRWNFNLFPVRNSIRTVDVALAQDEDRYGITPETDAEAAAAMQPASGNEAGSSTQAGQHQAMLGTQASQGQLAEMQSSGGGTGAVSYEVRCCGLFFSCGSSTSHQS